MTVKCIVKTCLLYFKRKSSLELCGPLQCDVMVEQYEDVIEDWYRGDQEEDLTSYLCEKHVLRGQDTGTEPNACPLGQEIPPYKHCDPTVC